MPASGFENRKADDIGFRYTSSDHGRPRETSNTIRLRQDVRHQRRTIEPGIHEKRLGDKLRRSRGGAQSIGSKAVREGRSEEHTSELQSLMRISYAVFCLTKKTNHVTNYTPTQIQNLRV